MDKYIAKNDVIHWGVCIFKKGTVVPGSMYELFEPATKLQFELVKE